jgi:hypothetical protein
MRLKGSRRCAPDFKSPRFRSVAIRQRSRIPLAKNDATFQDATPGAALGPWGGRGVLGGPCGLRGFSAVPAPPLVGVVDLASGRKM